jgi:hypothetical protein
MNKRSKRYNRDDDDSPSNRKRGLDEISNSDERVHKSTLPRKKPKYIQESSGEEVNLKEERKSGN